MLMRAPASSQSSDWIAHDVGKSINPVLVMGQVEGSVYMGLGEISWKRWLSRQPQRGAQVSL